MAWRRPRDPFPGPLAEFHEEDWPPVEGECLGHYACDYGSGYTAPCAPRPGEHCGQLHHEMLARDYPGRPDVLARAARIDAFRRWKAARLGWLGEGSRGWAEEFFMGAPGEHEVCYGPLPGARPGDDAAAQMFACRTLVRVAYPRGTIEVSTTGAGSLLARPGLLREGEHAMADSVPGELLGGKGGSRTQTTELPDIGATSDAAVAQDSPGTFADGEPVSPAVARQRYGAAAGQGYRGLSPDAGAP